MSRLALAVLVALISAVPCFAQESGFSHDLAFGARALREMAEYQKTEFVRPKRSPALEQAERERQDIRARVERATMIIRVFSPRGESTGTGVFVDPSGLAITNAHVVASSVDGLVDVEIGPKLLKRKARVLASAPGRDVAILQIIQEKGLKTDWPALVFGRVPAAGAIVFAVGNPVNQGFTFTSGDVGQTTNTVTNYWVDHIQLAIDLNPGNSGGPLVNISGALIGLNTAILRGEMVDGIGFAVPAPTLQGALAEYRQTRKLSDGFTSLSFGQDLTIVSVKAGSSAALAGYKVGDAVVSFAGMDALRASLRPRALYRQIARSKVGQTVPVVVVRGQDVVLNCSEPGSASTQTVAARFNPATGIVLVRPDDAASTAAWSTFGRAITRTSVETIELGGKLYVIQPMGQMTTAGATFMVAGWAPGGVREQTAVIVEPYTGT